MNRFFWTLVALEMAAFLVLFLDGLRAPSESGGREMGLFFGVLAPSIIVLCAALVYSQSSSTIAKSLALLVAAGPAIFVAVAWGRHFFLESSVRNSDVTAFHDPGQRILAQAIINGNASKVKQLAPSAKLNEPGLNELTGSDTTLLTLAISQRTPAMTEIAVSLLKAGADPNAAAEKGWNIPLARAISSGHGDQVAALLAAGADPNKKDPIGGVAYHVALMDINNDNVAILSQLLDHGAKPDITDGSGRTALMNAAIHGNWKAIDLLLTHGADKGLKDDKGKTALDYTEARIGESERSGGAVDTGLRAAAAKLK